MHRLPHGVTRRLNRLDIGADPTAPLDRIQSLLAHSPAEGAHLRLLPGVHRCGTLRLRSNLHLEIMPGAVLQCSPDRRDLESWTSPEPSRMDPAPWKTFLVGSDLENIRLSGGGTIHGSGEASDFQDGIENSPARPYGIWLIRCRKVHLTDLHLRNSGFWMLRVFACQQVQLHGLRIWNHANRNNDGLDIDSSQDVLISDCQIDSSDDALCLKSEGSAPCRNILIQNCILSSHASAFKTGSGSVGGFSNIVAANLIIRPSSSEIMKHPSCRWKGITGLNLATTDGGPLRSVILQNIAMEGVDNPLLLRLGNRLSGSGTRQGYASDSDHLQGVQGTQVGVPLKPDLRLEDVTIQNLVATDVGPYPAIVAGILDYPVRRITLRDVTILSSRPGTKADLETPPSWRADMYPSRLMFQTCLPAYGLATAFTEDLVVDNFRAVPAEGEVRPARWDLATESGYPQ